MSSPPLPEKTKIASIYNRWAAIRIDIFALFPIFLLGILVHHYLGEKGGIERTQTLPLVAFISVLVFIKDGFRGKSIGKRIIGIQVVKNGSSVAAGPFRCFVRNMLLGLFIIDLFVMWIDPKKRRIGDFIAGTSVVLSERESFRSFFLEFKTLKFRRDHLYIVSLIVLFWLYQAYWAWPTRHDGKTYVFLVPEGFEGGIKLCDCEDETIPLPQTFNDSIIFDYRLNLKYCSEAFWHDKPWPWTQMHFYQVKENGQLLEFQETYRYFHNLAEGPSADSLHLMSRYMVVQDKCINLIVAKGSNGEKIFAESNGFSLWFIAAGI